MKRVGIESRLWWVGPVVVLLFSGAAVARVTATAGTPLCDESTCRVLVTVAVPDGQTLRNVDLLLRVGASDPSEPLSALAGTEPWTSRAWTRIEKGRPTRTGVTASLVDPVPVEGDCEWLTEPSPRAPPHFVRLVRTALGDAGAIEVVLPAWGEQTVAVSVVGYEVAPVTASDFATLPGEGGVGLSTLLRSVGLAATNEAHRRVSLDTAVVETMVAAVRDRFGLPVGRQAPLTSNERWPIVSVAAAFWLLAEHAPDALVSLTVDRLRREEDSPFGLAMLDAVGAARGSDPLTWAIATQTLLPSVGLGLPDVRFLAEAAVDLPPASRARLVTDLEGAVGKQKNAAVAQFLDIAGPALIASVVGLPDDGEVRRVVLALSRMGTGSALAGVFGWQTEPVLDRVLEAVGEGRFASLGRAMVGGGIPDELLDALGSGSASARRLSAMILSGAGRAALDKLDARLVMAGHRYVHPVTAGEPPEDVVASAVSQLQGVLLAPLARPAHDEAWRLHELEQDCLGPFERARKEIHPQLLLPEPLYSRCRALRAVRVAEGGDGDVALELMADILRRAPSDTVVRRRHAQIVAAIARSLLDAGDLLGAEATLDELDRRDAEGLVGIRADIEARFGEEALARGDEDGARRRFEAASAIDPTQPSADARIDAGRHAVNGLLVALLVVTLCFGVGMAVWRRFQRAMTMHDFRLGAERGHAVFDGPGFRQLWLAPFGLLALRPLGFRLLAWSDLDRVYLLSGTSARSGLLIRMSDGSAFVVPTQSLGRFDLFIAAIEPFLDEIRRPLVTTRRANDETTVENDALVDSLQTSDRWRTVLRGVGIGVGALVAYSVAFIEAAGGHWYVRLPIGLGIAAGLVLITASVASALVPISRA
jgi:hypothetical protein